MNMSRKLPKSKKRRKKKLQKQNREESAAPRQRSSRKKFSKSQPGTPNYLAVLDFEATCEEREIQPAWVHEIIEFPVVFLNLKTGVVDYIFHSYVQPIEVPVLTDFCTNLTGITQDKVEEAPTLDEVIQLFEQFLEEHSMKALFDFPENGEDEFFSYVIATDGPWDFESFLITECNRKEIPFPSFAKFYINIRHWYANSRQLGNGKMHNVNRMLKNLGLSFIGRPHSGLDDAKNIARIAKVCFEKSPKISLKRVKGARK